MEDVIIYNEKRVGLFGNQLTFIYVKKELIKGSSVMVALVKRETSDQENFSG